MRPLGIRAKVLLLALLPAAVSALLLGGYQLLTATQVLQQALDERGQAIVDQLAPTALGCYRYGPANNAPYTLTPLHRYTANW